MDLFPFLCFSVIFSALVMVVQSGGQKSAKIIPTILILAEVYLLLLVEGIVGTPIGARVDTRTFMSGVVVFAALIDFLRLPDKSFALLAVFSSLIQLLASLGVLRAVSL